MSITRAEVARIALSFPNACESTAYGHPAWRIGKKFFTRIREEENSLVVHLNSIDERDMLIESDPRLFHITDHYRNHAMVLARLDRATPALVRGYLERRFRAIATKKQRAEWEAGRG